ncbi:MAG: GGDEF domain-containing protein [Candidatus Woesearchaeota archaeon]
MEYKSIISGSCPKNVTFSAVQQAARALFFTYRALYDMDRGQIFYVNGDVQRGKSRKSELSVEKKDLQKAFQYFQDIYSAFNIAHKDKGDNNITLKGMSEDDTIKLAMRAMNNSMHLEELQYHDMLRRGRLGGQVAKGFLQDACFMVQRGGLQSVSLVYIDMNDLKKLNDTYSVNIGNAAIKRIQARLYNSVRKTDIIGRLHETGDEFIGIFPGSYTGVQKRIQTVFAEIEKNPLEFEWENKTVSESLSVSAGVIDVSKIVNDGAKDSIFLTLEQIIEKANLTSKIAKTRSRGKDGRTSEYEFDMRCIV